MTVVEACSSLVGLAVEVMLLSMLIIAVIEGKVHITWPLRQRRQTDKNGGYNR